MKCMMLFLFLLFACSTEKMTNVIYIEVSPEKIILDQKPIVKVDLEKELKSVIDGRKAQGFKLEELIIDLRVDGRTRRGDLADIETTMRRLNIRKVKYSTLVRLQTSAYKK
jgi:hypothetical protein